VLALLIARLLQALAEEAHAVGIAVGRRGMEKPDHRHRPLLGLRRNGPSRRRAAEQRDELAPPQVEHATVSQWADHVSLTLHWVGRPARGEDLICSEWVGTLPG